MLWSHLQGYGLTKDRDHGNGSPQRAPPGLTDFFFLMSTRTVKALRSLTTTFLPSKTTEPSYRGFPAEIGDGGGHKHGEGVLKESFLQWKLSVLKSLCA